MFPAMTIGRVRRLGRGAEVVVDREVRFRGISKRGDLADMGRSIAAPVYDFAENAEAGEIARVAGEAI
jgi:hypothetical protein